MSNRQTRAHKIALSFEEFSAGLLGQWEPRMFNSNIFFVHAGKAGKVEINLLSGTFTIGSGSKYLNEITAAAEAAEYVILKRNKGWSIVSTTLLNGPNAQTITGKFNCLVNAVMNAIPANSSKKSNKTPKKVETVRENDKYVFHTNGKIVSKKTGKELTGAAKKSVEKSFVQSKEKKSNEIAKIKAKNLATIKAVHASFVQQVAA
jgi:hypothetical protein